MCAETSFRLEKGCSSAALTLMYILASAIVVFSTAAETLLARQATLLCVGSCDCWFIHLCSRTNETN